MANRSRNRYPTPVNDLVTELLDPVLRKRAGISMGLVQSWEEIVGQRVAAGSRPLKIQWPPRAHQEDTFEPATLIVACEGFAALHVQHETSEIIARVNAYLGFNAVGRIRIVQKPVQAAAPPRAAPPWPIDEAQAAALKRTVADIEDDALRASLERLGASVLGSKPRER